MRKIPLMILGDAPDLPSGLARIGRDLASRLVTMPELDVCYLGLGGVGTTLTPYRLMNIQETGGYAMWGQRSFGPAWRSFARDRRGILFSIWDPMRVAHIGQPKMFAPEDLQELFQSGQFQKWGYFPIDAHGPGLKFTTMVKDILSGYDRRLYYTRWAQRVAVNSGVPGEWIPHGLDPVWQPYDPKGGRESILKMPEDAFLVGCVSTNQPRKDWGTTFAAISRLRHEHRMNVFLWAHIDTLRKVDAWDLQALTHDCGIRGRVIVTHSMSDAQLALCYAACNVTFANGLGEGFGYPIAESLACGTPVVHVNYGGGADMLPDEMRVTPCAYRLTGVLNDVRPVLDECAVAGKLVEVAKLKHPALAGYVEHLKWDRLWPVWKRWFYEGVEEVYGYRSDNSNVGAGESTGECKPPDGDVVPGEREPSDSGSDGVPGNEVQGSVDRA